MIGLPRGLLQHAECPDGFPNLAFEAFYQKGLECYRWRLPNIYAKQAFKVICQRYEGLQKPISFWHLRAFVAGKKGFNFHGTHIPAEYKWPIPPDPSWRTIVCVYPDGQCDLDFVHPVSRKFWSEDNDFLDLPSYDVNEMGAWWFSDMGFEILHMQESLEVTVSEKASPHLRLA